MPRASGRSTGSGETSLSPTRQRANARRAHGRLRPGENLRRRSQPAPGGPLTRERTTHNGSSDARRRLHQQPKATDRWGTTVRAPAEHTDGASDGTERDSNDFAGVTGAGSHRPKPAAAAHRTAGDGARRGQPQPQARRTVPAAARSAVPAAADALSPYRGCELRVGGVLVVHRAAVDLPARPLDHGAARGRVGARDRDRPRLPQRSPAHRIAVGEAAAAPLRRPVPGRNGRGRHLQRSRPSRRDTLLPPAPGLSRALACPGRR